VFLDEVGELTPAIQVKLLRAIEERAVRRVGGLKASAIDVRFVAATNRDLEAELGRGGFRADLYYRLAGATVTIPPLRERGDAIEPLAQAIVEEAARRVGKPAPAIAAETLALLRAHRWPGNVRELRNVLERAVLMATVPTLLPEHLPAALLSSAGRTSPAAAGAPAPIAVPGAPGWWQPDAAARERERIIAALEASDGHQGKAATLLGISRRTLLNRLDALGLPRPRKPAG
jgi:DNA-binding NtrC family response regulator